MSRRHIKLITCCLLALSVAKTAFSNKFKQLMQDLNGPLCYKPGPMIPFFMGLFTCLSAFLRSRYNLGLEILVLRQQVGVLKRKVPRPRLQAQDRVFWILLPRLWPAWRSVLVIVRPETVWPGIGLAFGCSGVSARAQTALAGPGSVPRFDLSSSGWRGRIPPGAPRIHGELLKLGFEVSERTVSRYLRRLSPSGQAPNRWSAFLRSHRELITAMDFFTVPTLTFRVSSCFFVIERRKVLHCKVTQHPTGPWIVQQLRQAFPEFALTTMRFLIGMASLARR